MVLNREAAIVAGLMKLISLHAFYYMILEWLSNSCGSVLLLQCGQTVSVQFSRRPDSLS